MTTEKIKIEIDASADRASGEIDAFGNRLGVLGGGIGKITGLLGGMTIGFGAAAAAAVTIVRGVAETADGMSKMSQRTGMAVESLSALKYAGELSGVSVDTLDSRLGKLVDSMDAAARGQGEAAGAFRAMGISVTDANGKLRGSEEVLRDVADKFAGYRDGAEKAALAQSIFGKAGADMIPLLNQGRDGLDAMRSEAERLGLVIDTETAKAAEEFNDNLAKIQAEASGLAITIAGPLIRSLANLTSQFVEARREGEGFWASLDRAMNGEGRRLNVRDAAADIEAAAKELKRIDALLAQYGDSPDDRLLYDRGVASAKLAEATANYNALAQQLVSSTTSSDKPAAPMSSGGGKGGGGGRGPKKAKQDEWGRGDGFANFGAEKLALELAEQQALWDKQIEADELNAQRAAAARFAQIQLGLLSERELENHHYLEKRNNLLIAMEQEGADRTAHQEALAQLELQHQARLGDIEAQGTLARRRFEEMNAQQKTQFFFGQMAQMTAGVANQSRALFNIHKAAAIAEAAVSLPKGVQLTFDSYPWPWNIPAAAIHLATGLARIAQIKSAQFGTSSSPASVGGGSAAPVFVPAASPMTSEPAPPSVGQAAAPRTQVNLTLVGSTFSYKQVVEEIIPMINEAAGNGADIRVATA